MTLLLVSEKRPPAAVAETLGPQSWLTLFHGSFGLERVVVGFDLIAMVSIERT